MNTKPTSETVLRQFFLLRASEELQCGTEQAAQCRGTQASVIMLPEVKGVSSWSPDDLGKCRDPCGVHGLIIKRL